MIVILNEKLEEECPPNATMKECFWKLQRSVAQPARRHIAEIIHTPGTINVDFEDEDRQRASGSAIIGLAMASGPDRARVAEAAIACLLLEGANLQGRAACLFTNPSPRGAVSTRSTAAADCSAAARSAARLSQVLSRAS